MVFVPTLPNQSSPTWGHACGLLSFQLMGVMVASPIIAALTDRQIGIISSIVITIYFSVMYLILAERRVPGSLSQKRYRGLLALKTSVLLSLISVGVPLVYSAPGAIDSGRFYVLFGLLVVGALISGVGVFIGLELGAEIIVRVRKRT